MKEGLSLTGWPVGMYVGIVLIVLIDVGRPTHSVGSTSGSSKDKRAWKRKSLPFTLKFNYSVAASAYCFVHIRINFFRVPIEIIRKLKVPGCLGLSRAFSIRFYEVPSFTD